MRKRKRVVFGTSSWGLGHATRDLVLLRALLEAGCEVTVVATGPALRVLRGELGEACRYLDWPDMPSTIAHTTAGFYLKLVTFIPRILGSWFADMRRLARLLCEQPIDLVVTDHRYGLVTGRVPCYFITHSPRYMAPWRSWFMETVMEGFVACWLTPARKVLIPDQAEEGLSGDMSHRLRFLPEHKRVFLGLLSSVERREVGEDVDVFISISGPEPQRTRLERIVLAQVHELAGRVLVALGLPPDKTPTQDSDGAGDSSEKLRGGGGSGGVERGDLPSNIEVHDYLDRAAQQKMMNRSGLVVCRSGYTTLMELAESGKRALLIPTPAQTEQLYLADTLRERGLYHSVRQHDLSLARDVEKARCFPGYQAREGPAEAARRFLETIGV